MKDLFRKKDFMKMFIASIISRFGDAVDAIAFGYLVYELTGSKLLLASIFVVNVIPNIIFSTFSAAVVDFYSKKAIVVIGDFARAAMVGIAAYLFSIDGLATWHLFVLTFINSTIETFVAPCKAATIPKLVDKEQYLQVNSTFDSIRGMAELIGLGAGGTIIAMIGLPGAMLVDVLTFVVSGVIILFVKFPFEEKVKLTLSNYVTSYKEGLSYVLKSKGLLGLLVTAALINFFLTPFNALMPAYVKDVLHMGPQGMSFMMVSISVGAVLGGILAGILGKKMGPKAMILLGLSLLACFYLVLGLPSYIPLFKSLIIMSIDFALLGAMASVAGAALRTIIMTTVDDDKRARVAGVAGMFTTTATPLGAVVAGVCVAFMPLSLMIISFAVAIFFTLLIPVLTLQETYLEKDFAA